jgi:hypothetical protein
MARKRYSLFPQESAAYLSASTQLEPKVKSNLFGMDDGDKSPIDDLETENPNKESVINFLGGNIHHLKDGQLQRLLSIKYNNDPTLLIKQLSIDLANKESELILLRQQKFVREQKLIKLCNDYGNLSTLEINQKLDDGSVSAPQSGSSSAKNEPEKVNNILKDLVGNAINEDIVSHRPMSRSSESEIASPQPTRGLKSNSSKSWLRNWFNSSEDLSTPAPSEAIYPKRPHSRSFPLNFKNTSDLRRKEPSSETSFTKVPLELDSINLRGTDLHDEQDLKSDSSLLLPKNLDEINIDKYGFFTDIDHIVKDRSFIATSQDQQEEVKPPNTDSELLSRPSNVSLEDFQAILIGNKDKLQTIDHLKEISKIHDTTNLQFEMQWDNLVKDIKKDFYKYKNEDHDMGSEIFGIHALNLIKLDNTIEKSSSLRSPQYYDRLISLIVQVGISPKYRLQLWLEMSGAKNLRVNGEYQQLLNEVKLSQTEDSMNTENPRMKTIQNNLKQINLDLHRTLPWNYYFNNLIELKPGPNFYKLQRILYAFVSYRTDIGYYQGMNKIIGNLLLILSKSDGTSDTGYNEHFNEEDIFWIFIGLIEEVLPKYSDSHLNPMISTNVSSSRALHALNHQERVFFTSLMNIKIDQMIMNRIYMPRHIPKLASHFHNLDIEVDLITMNWWLSVFIDLKFLDLDTWFKIFDMLLVGDIINRAHETETDSTKPLSTTSVNRPHSSDYYDAKIEKSKTEDQKAIKLISLSLAIFKCLENHLRSMQSKEEVYQFLNSNNNENSKGMNSPPGSRTFGGRSTKVNLKFTDLMKYTQLYFKSFGSIELNQYRREFIEREGI